MIRLGQCWTLTATLRRHPAKWARLHYNNAVDFSRLHQLKSQRTVCWVQGMFSLFCLASKNRSNSAPSTLDTKLQRQGAQLRHYILVSLSPFCFSVSARPVGMANTTAIHISPAPWTQRTSGACLTTAATSYNACTCASMSSCDHPYHTSSSLFCSTNWYWSLILFKPTKSCLLLTICSMIIICKKDKIRIVCVILALWTTCQNEWLDLSKTVSFTSFTG